MSALSSALTGHSANTGIHVTQEEKTAWSTGVGFAIGYYTGTGNTTQKITLGYKPRFGIVYPVDDGVGRINWTPEQYFGNTGFISQHGCTLGLVLENDGFIAQESMTGGADGFSIKLNRIGVRYVYFLWK